MIRVEFITGQVNRIGKFEIYSCYFFSKTFFLDMTATRNEQIKELRDLNNDIFIFLQRH